MTVSFDNGVIVQKLKGFIQLFFSIQLGESLAQLKPLCQNGNVLHNCAADFSWISSSHKSSHCCRSEHRLPSHVNWVRAPVVLSPPPHRAADKTQMFEGVFSRGSAGPSAGALLPSHVQLSARSVRLPMAAAAAARKNVGLFQVPLSLPGENDREGSFFPSRATTQTLPNDCDYNGKVKEKRGCRSPPPTPCRPCW